MMRCVMMLLFLLIGPGLLKAAALSEVSFSLSPRIVVLPLSNASGDAGLDVLETGFSDLLAGALSSLQDVTVLERDALSAVAFELARGLSGQVDARSSVRLGRLSGANMLLKGSFTLQGKDLLVTLHLYELESARLLASTQAAGKLTTLAELGETLASKLVARLTRGDALNIALPLDRQPRINLHFMKGLGFYYNQLYDHAIAEFMLVNFMRPGHADAAYWTAKSYYDSGDFEHARIALQTFIQAFAEHEKSDKASDMLRSLGATP